MWQRAPAPSGDGAWSCPPPAAPTGSSNAAFPTRRPHATACRARADAAGRRRRPDSADASTPRAAPPAAWLRTDQSPLTPALSPQKAERESDRASSIFFLDYSTYRPSSQDQRGQKLLHDWRICEPQSRDESLPRHIVSQLPLRPLAGGQGNT